MTGDNGNYFFVGLPISAKQLSSSIHGTGGDDDDDNSI